MREMTSSFFQYLCWLTRCNHIGEIEVKFQSPLWLYEALCFNSTVSSVLSGPLREYFSIIFSLFPFSSSSSYLALTSFSNLCFLFFLLFYLHPAPLSLILLLLSYLHFSHLSNLGIKTYLTIFSELPLYDQKQMNLTPYVLGLPLFK